MSGFDISNLVRFNTPSYLCEKCLAIDEPAYNRRRSESVCGVCHVEYLATMDYRKSEVDHYLSRERRLDIRFSDPIAHGKTLATIAGDFNRTSGPGCDYPPDLHALYRLLLAAESFIHFSSMNITHVLIGAMKLISHRVGVRGLVTGVRSDTAEELMNNKDEAPQFGCHVFEPGPDAPHQKLIIVDGLLALYGSANLTHPSWRKTGRGLEILEVVTDVAKVKELNNKYFAPIWGRMSGIGQSIEMIGF